MTSAVILTGNGTLDTAATRIVMARISEVMRRGHPPDQSVSMRLCPASMRSKYVADTAPMWGSALWLSRSSGGMSVIVPGSMSHHCLLVGEIRVKAMGSSLLVGGVGVAA